MIETRIFSFWDGLVGSAALIAIIILALCVIVSAIKVAEVPRHLGVIVGIIILLIMLPAIFVSLWNSMTLGQHLGIVTLGITILAIFGASRRAPKGLRRN